VSFFACEVALLNVKRSPSRIFIMKVYSYEIGILVEIIIKRKKIFIIIINFFCIAVREEGRVDLIGGYVKVRNYPPADSCHMQIREKSQAENPPRDAAIIIDSD
jgi:hypothetical protein